MKDFETATQEYLDESEAAYSEWAETLKQIDDKYDNMFTNP